MNKILPEENIVKTQEAKDEAIHSITSFGATLAGTLVVLLIIAVMGDGVSGWLRVIPAIIFSSMVILRLMNAYQKVKALGQLAMDSAHSYDEEAYARSMAEADLSMEVMRNKLACQ